MPTLITELPTPRVLETTPASAKKQGGRPKKVKEQKKWGYSRSQDRARGGGSQADRRNSKAGAKSPRLPSTTRAASKVERSRVTKEAAAIPEKRHSPKRRCDPELHSSSQPTTPTPYRKNGEGSPARLHPTSRQTVE